MPSPNQSICHYLWVCIEIMYWPFSLSATSKDTWISFSSNFDLWKLTRFTLSFSSVCDVYRTPHSSFSPLVFPQNTTGLTRTYCFSSSGYFIYNAASSAHITFFSGNIPKLLPTAQSMIAFKIPGPLGFPVQAHCILGVPHLFHGASVAWRVEQILPLNSLNIQALAVRVPRGAVLQY